MGSSSYDTARSRSALARKRPAPVERQGRVKECGLRHASRFSGAADGRSLERCRRTWGTHFARAPLALFDVKACIDAAARGAGWERRVLVSGTPPDRGEEAAETQERERARGGDGSDARVAAEAVEHG